MPDPAAPDPRSPDPRTPDPRSPDPSEPDPGPTRHAVLGTSLGDLVLVADDEGLVGLYFPGHRTRPDPRGLGPRVLGPDPLLDEAAVQVRGYLAGERTAFDLPLRPRGSARAQEVWRLIGGVPYGSTTTYQALAVLVGRGTSPRAVGGLVGRNPLSIVVPCHRVVGSDGALTGYAGGLDRKRRLLELEGVLPAALMSW